MVQELTYWISTHPSIRFPFVDPWTTVPLFCLWVFGVAIHEALHEKQELVSKFLQAGEMREMAQDPSLPGLTRATQVRGVILDDAPRHGGC